MSIVWELLCTVLFLAAFGALVLRWLSQSGLEAVGRPFSDPLPARRSCLPGKLELWQVFVLAVLFRAASAWLSVILYDLATGSGMGVMDLPELWQRWDGPNYLKLAELGYGGHLEDGKPLFLVFFPLYAWAIRAVSAVIPNTAAAALLVSFLSFGGGCVYIYRLASEEYGDRTARRTLLLICAYPFSFFFGALMPESLFLLTTAAAFYHIRSHHWTRAALWGILAALTRMHGILLIGVAIAEICCEEKPFAGNGEARKRGFAAVFKRLPLLLAPILGSLGYLALNYHVTGDPFAFVEMEKHWSQGFMWFPKVLSYLAQNALSWPEASTCWEMWIPEVVLFPIFALLLWGAWKKHRSMFTLYAFVYLILNYCLSWLLSAGRYLACALPFFFFAGDELEGKPWLTAALTAGMALLQCFFCVRYLCWGQVM